MRWFPALYAATGPSAYNVSVRPAAPRFDHADRGGGRCIAPFFDVLHEPHYQADGRRNFEYFCCRDINRFAENPHFVKLDCDTILRHDWVDYLDESLSDYPDTVLFGPTEGMTSVSYELSGPLVEKKLGGGTRVTNGRKLMGGFYVGQTRFFKENDYVMRTIHEFFCCFKDGRRRRPSLCPSDWDDDDPALEPIISNYPAWGRCPEDHLRSFVVHAMDAGDRLRCLASGERVRIVY